MSSLCFDQERLEHPVSPALAFPGTAPPSFPCCHGSQNLTVGNSDAPLTEVQACRWNGKEYTKGSRRSRVTIDVLPDLALLEIFHFYVAKGAWYTLVHVCRKWRNVVFGSPRRLNLQLFFTASTSMREMLRLWPHNLPIAVWDERDEALDTDNIFAALELHDRICDLNLIYSEDDPYFELNEILEVLQRPFPELTRLRLGYGNDTTPVVPDSFLGGSAPRLRFLTLLSIPFPGLPKLLLSATHLVYLNLSSITHSGYISPEAMLTGLSMSTRLETLVIEFETSQSRPARETRCSPPQTRTLLPVLNKLEFVGVKEYLENFVAWIDAPLLDKLDITFFHQQLFDLPQLTRFIGRAMKLKTYNEARLKFSHDGFVRVTLPQTSGGEIKLTVECEGDSQLSSLAQLCSSFFRRDPISASAVEHLYITEFGTYPLDWPDIESSRWQELFHAFSAVKGLYISQKVALTLQVLVGERVTEMLPALQTLFLDETPPPGPVQEIIGQFVASRQLANHPIAVSSWKRDRYDFHS